MCGIIYVKRFDGKRAGKMVNKRYQKQRERGEEGFGYVAVDDGFVTDYKRTATEKEIMENIEKDSSNEMLFHHRYPTSTPNFAHCAHPIKVSHQSLKYDYYVVHNGIIWNDDDLKVIHDEHGYVYSTEVKNEWTNQSKVIRSVVKWNDSESFAIELARDLDNLKFGISHVRGSIAFIALQVEKKTRQTINLFFGRNHQSPLVVDLVDDEYLAITSLGKGDDVKAHELYELNLQTLKLTSKTYIVGTTYEWSKSTYRYEDDVRPSSMGFRNIALPGATTEYKDTGILVPKNLNGYYEEPISDYDAEEYYDLLTEKDAIEEILKKENLSENERIEWENELIEITSQIKGYDDKLAEKILSSFDQ